MPDDPDDKRRDDDANGDDANGGDGDGGDALDTLAALLAAHEVEVRRDGDWLILPRGCRAAAVFHVRGKAPVIQLDVIFEPWTGCQVIESVVGVGPSRREREANAWQAFAAASLHVLLAAFLYLDEAQVERTAWEIDGTVRAVTLGPVVERGAGPADRSWLGAVRDIVAGSNLPEGTHWVRLFYAHDRGAKMACEVLLDNEPWEDARDAFDEVAWPVSDDYYSVRLFLVVQGGLDVSRAVGVLADRPGADDDDHARALIELGFDATDAELLVAFIPLAFGRVLVADLPVTFSSTAVVERRSGGEPITIDLDDDPIYGEATWLAGRAHDHGTLTRQQFLDLALRSAEIDALNQALNAGAKPEDLEFAAPIISVP